MLLLGILFKKCVYNRHIFVDLLQGSSWSSMPMALSRRAVSILCFLNSSTGQSTGVVTILQKSDFLTVSQSDLH